MEESDDSRLASLLAYHLVNLVLQEGCMIANAALDSGRPREFLSTRVNVRSDLTYIIPAAREDATNVDTAEDKFVEGPDNAKESEHLLVTSTPQKVGDADDKPKKENGQGDEFTDDEQTELKNSTSIFINHLFDISELELGIGERANSAQEPEYNEMLPPFISNVMDFYMNAALDAFRASEEKEEGFVDKRVNISDNSSFSYIEDEIEEPGKDVVSCVADDENQPCTEDVYQIPRDPMTSQMALQCTINKDIKTENSELYENTYLTLNRDYEQCSDEEDFPILQDPRGMLMQEIELLTANTSNDTDRSYAEPEEDIHIDKMKSQEGLAATSGLSAASRKSGLVRRWRLQGARILSCLRGWWRRRVPGKRKLPRSPGQRPFSPRTRRRAASLLDQRVSQDLPPHVKCNTINEALINSQHWMDYTFEIKLNDCGDV